MDLEGSDCSDCSYEESGDENQPVASHGHGSRHPELTEVEKWRIYAFASRYYDFVKGCFRSGGRGIVTKQFGVSISTVKRIMEEGRIQNPNEVSFASKKVGVVGKKRKVTDEELNKIKELNKTHKKDTVDDFSLEVSNMLGRYVPPSTLQDWMHKYLGCISKCCKPKPSLTEEHKIRRMEWVLNMIDWDFESMDDSSPLYFRDQRGTVYLDEAWIYHHLQHYNMRLLADQEPDEEDFEVQTSRMGVPKYMSLSAFSHPHPGNNDDDSWKICCVDVVETKEYKYRTGGVDISYNLDSKAFYEYMAGKHGILTLAWEKLGCYAQPGKPVKVIMDNAPPHVGKDNVKKLNLWIQKQHWNMIVETLPSQSPDFNIMDLSLWYSFQTQVHKMRFEHAREGLAGVRVAMHDVYNSYDRTKVEKAFGGLWANFNACLEHNGDNRYPRVKGSVRAKYERGERLDVVHFTRRELLEKKHAVERYHAQCKRAHTARKK